MKDNRIYKNVITPKRKFPHLGYCICVYTVCSRLTNLCF